VADEQNAGVPPTIVKPRKTPLGYTGASGFVGAFGVASLVVALGYGTYVSMSAGHAAASSTPQPMPILPASAPPVPDPTADPPSPAPAASVSVTTAVHAAAVVVQPPTTSVQQPTPVVPIPRSSPTISASAQYQAEEEARTLASRRASSVVKFTQDDQARQDLAAAGGSQQPQEPVAPPAPSSTSLFASSDVSSADRFVGQNRHVGYVAPVSRYQVDAGTPVQAVTSSTVDSTFPAGIVISQITAPVFASRDSDVTVIPQGTKLLVTYNANAAQGVARLQSVGTRLVFPDAREFDLGGSSQAAGLQGETGMSASVDTHAGKAFGNAALSALLGAALNLTSRSTTNVNLGSAANVQQPQQLPPTMHVKAGTPFTFVVAEDLPLDRYEVAR
jgi:type IV secretory pathway VirB10-like protein